MKLIRKFLLILAPIVFFLSKIDSQSINNTNINGSTINTNLKTLLTLQADTGIIFGKGVDSLSRLISTEAFIKYFNSTHSFWYRNNKKWLQIANVAYVDSLHNILPTLQNILDAPNGNKLTHSDTILGGGHSLYFVGVNSGDSLEFKNFGTTGFQGNGLDFSGSQANFSFAGGVFFTNGTIVTFNNGALPFQLRKSDNSNFIDVKGVTGIGGENMLWLPNENNLDTLATKANIRSVAVTAFNGDSIYTNGIGLGGDIPISTRWRLTNDKTISFTTNANLSKFFFNDNSVSSTYDSTNAQNTELFGRNGVPTSGDYWQGFGKGVFSRGTGSFNVGIGYEVGTWYSGHNSFLAGNRAGRGWNWDNLTLVGDFYGSKVYPNGNNVSIFGANTTTPAIASQVCLSSEIATGTTTITGSNIATLISAALFSNGDSASFTLTFAGTPPSNSGGDPFNTTVTLIGVVTSSNTINLLLPGNFTVQGSGGFTLSTNLKVGNVTILGANAQATASNQAVLGANNYTTMKTGQWIWDIGTTPTDGQMWQYNGTSHMWVLITPAAGVSSFASRIGTITPVSGDYSSFYPLLSGSYTNPSWIVSLPWSKITSTPTTLSGYGITDALSSTGQKFAIPFFNTSAVYTTDSTKIGYDGASMFSKTSILGDTTMYTVVQDQNGRYKYVAPISQILFANRTNLVPGVYEKIDTSHVLGVFTAVIGNDTTSATGLSGYYVRKKDSINTINGYTTLYQNSLKQNLITLTTTSTGAATFNQSTGALNIPTPTASVTTFSAGTLSPLFTTSVATATTTPALTFTLSTAAAYKFFGNNTGSTAAPTESTLTTTSGASTDSILTINTATGQPRYLDNANFVKLTGTQTLTNKTIAAGSNTITGLTNSSLSGTAGIANANLANSTISGIALGSSLGSVTPIRGLTGTAYNGASNSNFGLDTTLNYTFTTGMKWGSNAYYDQTNSTFVVNKNTVTPTASNLQGYLLIGADGTSPQTTQIAYGGSPQALFQRYDGTSGIPTAVVSTDALFSVIGEGYDGTSMSAAAGRVQMQVYGSQWTTGKHGTQWIVALTDSNSTTIGTRMAIFGNGHTVFKTGSSAPVDAGYLLDVKGTVRATDTITATNGVKLVGSSSGVISLLPQSAAGTFNWNYPITAGSSGQLLTSGGGSSTAMSWTSLNAISATKSHVIFTPTTGGTVTLTNNTYNIINPAGALVALTITLPSSPSNNDVVMIKYTQAVTTVTYNGGTIADGIISPTAGGYVILVYDSGATTWY